MKRLIINGSYYGFCREYKQERNALVPGWVFLMETGIEIKVPFFAISSFNSCDVLEIITFRDNA